MSLGFVDMEDNPEDYMDFIPYTESEGPAKAWERYLNKMRKKGWGGPHELRALEAALNIKFEIWLATFNELEEVTDIQVQRHHPVNMEKSTVKLWYEANAQNDMDEDLGDHYMSNHKKKGRIESLTANATVDYREPITERHVNVQH
jgi:hypothetical protein